MNKTQAHPHRHMAHEKDDPLAHRAQAKALASGCGYKIKFRAKSHREG